MQYSSNCVILGGLLCCAICLGAGVVVGYFARNSDSKTSVNNRNKGKITAYQKSCEFKCATEVEQATSCSVPMPRYYVAHHLNGKNITVDGNLDDEAWQNVPWTENFVDIRGIGYPKPSVDTRVKIRWDDQKVYVGAYLQESHLWATYTVKDTRIYQENAFEVFFDVDTSMSMYKEVEINVLATTWDLMLSRAYMDGGKFSDWEGIAEKGVYSDGRPNDPTSNATFWSLEMSFPFAKLAENTTRSGGPAVDGEMWFMILARPQYKTEAYNGAYRKVPGTDASWFSWNPTGAVNLHLPSRWGLLFFEKDNPSGKQEVSNKRWIVYKALFDIFDALKTFKAVYGTYVTDLKVLSLPAYITTNTCIQTVLITLPAVTGFEVTIVSEAETNVQGHIREDRKVWFT